MYQSLRAHPAGRLVPLDSGSRASLLLLAVFAICTAAAADPVDWHTGAAYRRALSKPLSIYWPGSPIRDALMRLSRQERVAVFLDRRVDPDMNVDYRSQGVAPLAELLKAIAASKHLGVASIGAVVYVGPAETASKLPTLLDMRRQETGRLPPTVAKRLAQSRVMRWETLTTPQELFERVEQDYQVQFFDKQLAPHDLWPAADLPPMSFSERMTLLLAGFPLTYEYAERGSAIRLTRIPDQMTIRRAQENTVTRRTVTPGEKRFTLKVENQPVGPLIKVLAARLDLELTFDASAQSRLDELVSLNVEQVPRDQLIRAALAPAELDFRVKDGALFVFRAR